MLHPFYRVEVLFFKRNTEALHWIKIQSMASRKWLEDMSKGLGRELEAVTLQGIEINLVQKGLLGCTFLVPESLSVSIFVGNNISENVFLEN